MSSNFQISLIALEVRKWDIETQKITSLSYYLLNDEEKNISFDVSILQPPEMVEEYLGKMRYEAEQRLREKHQDEKIAVEFDNETFLRQKIYNYFKRITSELNNPRRKKGQPKMILTTHMDTYNENQDISFLPARFQFLIILNWARKYYEKAERSEDYKKAIEPLKKLVKFAPDYGLGYKWLARSLKKVRKYDEAMRTYEKYAEVDGSIDAWLDLAKSYRKGKIFDKSENIYQKILADDPANKEARIGLAQIYYALKDERYLEILDQIHQEDPAWMKEWLIEEFNFRIYISEKTLLSTIQAAKFLGYKQYFELTQRAFKNEIPSHFNPTKARLSFYKEELENWAMVMNRYNCLKEKIEIYPDRVSQNDEEAMAIEEILPGAMPKTDASGKELTRVEEILMQIRARKAQREASKRDDSPLPASPDNKPAGAQPGNNRQGKASLAERNNGAKTVSDKIERESEDNNSKAAHLEEKPKSTSRKKSRDNESPSETQSDADKSQVKKRGRGKSSQKKAEETDATPKKKRASRKKE